MNAQTRSAPTDSSTCAVSAKPTPRSSTDSVAEQIQWEGIEFLHAEERTNYPLTLSVDDLGVGFALTA
ncbi:hypothetical protein, partial [Bradyrhizobium sp.]|uniref:hypothetical protein n=1 Tax=Bradyrhizobium sp. TaxID=376 RepID=UPI00391B666D